MPAKYFPVGRAHLVLHFGFEMADEFTRNTFPFRFTIPPASLDPSVPRPGPDLFHNYLINKSELSRNGQDYHKRLRFCERVLTKAVKDRKTTAWNFSIFDAW